MTTLEMYDYFQLLSDSAAEVDMGFNENEIAKYLNLAIYDFIDERKSGYTNPSQRGYEIGEKRDLEFKELKEYVEVTSFTVSDKLPNSYTVDLPFNYLYNSFERVDITFKGNSYINVRVKPKNEDEINELLQNPFEKPDFREVWRLTEKEDSTQRILLVLNDSNIGLTTYKLSYIRKPAIIVIDLATPSNCVDCDLHDSTHKEIVRKAVNIAHASSGNPKFQISKGEMLNHY